MYVRTGRIHTQCFWSEHVLTFLHPIVRNGFGMNAFRPEVPEIIGLLISPVRIHIAFYTNCSIYCIKSMSVTSLSVAMGFVLGGWLIRLAYCCCTVQCVCTLEWTTHSYLSVLKAFSASAMWCPPVNDSGYPIFMQDSRAVYFLLYTCHIISCSN